MWSFIPALITGVSSIAKSFFGLQESKIETMQKVVETINSSNMSAAEREKAVASVIASEASSGYWMSATWRPMLMLILSLLVVAYCFGWTTPNLTTQLPESSMIAQLFELLKIGVMGYMPLRTVDKVVEAVTRANVLKQLLSRIPKE